MIIQLFSFRKNGKGIMYKFLNFKTMDLIYYLEIQKLGLTKTLY